MSETGTSEAVQPVSALVVLYENRSAEKFHDCVENEEDLKKIHQLERRRRRKKRKRWRSCHKVEPQYQEPMEEFYDVVDTDANQTVCGPSQVGEESKILGVNSHRLGSTGVSQDTYKDKDNGGRQNHPLSVITHCTAANIKTKAFGMRTKGDSGTKKDDKDINKEQEQNMEVTQCEPCGEIFGVHSHCCTGANAKGRNSMDVGQHRHAKGRTQADAESENKTVVEDEAEAENKKEELDVDITVEEGKLEIRCRGWETWFTTPEETKNAEKGSGSMHWCTKRRVKADAKSENITVVDNQADAQSEKERLNNDITVGGGKPEIRCTRWGTRYATPEARKTPKFCGANARCCAQAQMRADAESEN